MSMRQIIDGMEDSLRKAEEYFGDEGADYLVDDLIGDPGPSGSNFFYWLGAWDVNVQPYGVGNVVSHNLGLYISMSDATTTEPGVDAGWDDEWDLMVQGV